MPYQANKRPEPQPCSYSDLSTMQRKKRDLLGVGITLYVARIFDEICCHYGDIRK